MPHCFLQYFKREIQQKTDFLKAETLDLRKENTSQAFIHSFLLECLLYARDCSDTQEVRQDSCFQDAHDLGRGNQKIENKELIDSGKLPGLGRSPGGGHGNPLQYSCLENLHGYRRLMGYSPWGHKESNTTE